MPEEPLEPPELPELPGMLELLPPLEPDDPLEGLDGLDDEEPPLEGLGTEVGMLEEDDCPAQPPIRKAETVPMAVACAAITSRRSIAERLFIGFSRMESGTQPRAGDIVVAAVP